MLKFSRLIESFPQAEELRVGLYRFRDVTPKFTYHYYTQLGEVVGQNRDLLVVSENGTDDEFAFQIFDAIPVGELEDVLRMTDLPRNKYGFSKLLLAGKEFHSYFKGRLDAERERLVFCLPFHHCEFSGDETAEEFAYMRRETVQTLNWRREVCPKILLGFDNPKTQGGSGDRLVLAKYGTLLREIGNMDGVANGFMEVTNYRGQVVEILSPEGGRYALIKERNDESKVVVNKTELLEKLHRFLTI